MKNQKISSLIIRMAKRDQEVRKIYQKDPSCWKKVNKVDQINLHQMKNIIHTVGWPTIFLVGKKASHSAWLLVQHADQDIVFQKHCLKLLKEAVKNQDGTATEVAYLTDRILVNQNKPQLYGTQFFLNQKGKIVPKPINNKNLLNKRRKRIGLTAFKAYKQNIVKLMPIMFLM